MTDLEKHETKTAVDPHLDPAEGPDEDVGVVAEGGKLHTDLRGRHMQMIAIGTHFATYLWANIFGYHHTNDYPLGGAIGAGLFIGSGGALYKGGPAALVKRIEKISLCFLDLPTLTAFYLRSSGT